MKNVDTILSYTCHVHGPFEFRKYLGTSFLHVRNAKSGKSGHDWEKHWSQQAEPMQVSDERGQ